jgi:hypothetical protein
MDDEIDIQQLFGAIPTAGYSEDTELAVKLVKASSAVAEFTEYMQETDTDFSDIATTELSELDPDEQMVMYAFCALSGSLKEMADQLDDDDDENPFKVSDGDDPVY